MSAAKRKGSAAETAVCRYLNERGWPHVERRALRGINDTGDVAGIPGVIIEVKNHAKHDLTGWWREAVTEAANDNGSLPIVWFKRRGTTNPADWFVLLDGHTLTRLLTEAGYGGDAA